MELELDLNPSQVFQSMAKNRLPFVEGAASILRPPMFSGVNYQFWKVRMKIFIESIYRGIWNAIVNGPYIPISIMNGVPVEKSYDELTDVENKKVQYDYVVTDEGTTDVTRARKHALIQKYEAV